MKAYLYPTYTNVYKNSVTPPTDVTHQIGQYDFNIGSFEKIVNIDDYDAVYYANDTEQKHPIYIYKNEKLVGHPKIPLNEETLTSFFINDDEYIDLGDGYSIKNDKVIGPGFDNQGRNYTASTENNDGDVPPEDRYNRWYDAYGRTQAIFKDNYCGMVKRAKTTYDSLFEGGTVTGINAIYDSRIDAMLVPCKSPDSGRLEFYNHNGQKLIMRSMIYKGDRDVINTLNWGGGNIYANALGAFALLNDIQVPGVSQRSYTVFMVPIPYRVDYIYAGQNTSRYRQNKIIPFFLRDKNGEYWLWCITKLSCYDGLDYPQTPKDEYSILLAKVKDLPISRYDDIYAVGGQPEKGKISSANAIWIETAPEEGLYTDPHNIDLLLDEMFNPEIGPSYNDGGPDIVGPDKDPYDGVLDNTDEMIGGEPNMEDKIEQDDGTYNDSGSIIRGWGNFYGSYVLNQGALSQYVNTLTWLNGKWGSLLWPVYNLMSDRIKNNTINLIHLPFRVPDANVAQRPFTVGNTAIMQSTTDRGLINDWELGRITGIATVNLLQKEITTDVVNLGVLGHYYDNFLDFAPYSSASLYIPYIGTVELPINLIQSTSEGEQKQLQLLFRINNSTGDMIVLLQVNGSTVKQWSGNCARDIQISVDATGGVLRSMSNTIVGGMLGAITGGLGGGLGGAVATAAAGGLSGFDYQVQKEMYEQSSPEMRSETTWGQTTGARLAAYEHKQQAAGAAGKAMVNSMQKLPEVNSSPVPNHAIGNMPTAGEIGFMGPQEVRLIVERPIIWRPKDYGDLIGYPTKKIAKLSSVKGFAKVSNIHLRCNATLAEKTEIEQMLNAGVIFSDN